MHIHFKGVYHSMYVFISFDKKSPAQPRIWLALFTHYSEPHGHALAVKGRKINLITIHDFYKKLRFD